MEAQNAGGEKNREAQNQQGMSTPKAKPGLTGSADQTLEIELTIRAKATNGGTILPIRDLLIRFGPESGESGSVFVDSALLRPRMVFSQAEILRDELVAQHREPSPKAPAQNPAQ